MKVGVVIPVYNEKNRIGEVLARFSPGLTQAALQRDIPLSDVVVVDDGSDDGTPEVLKKAGVAHLRHSQRQGVGSAIRDGLDYLRAKHMEVAVVMAGNGKDEPAEIPRVVAPIFSGEADYVQGSRFFQGGSFKNLPISRYLMVKGYTWMWTLLVGRRLTDVTNGFRAYRLSLLEDERIRLDQEWLNTYELEYYIHYKVLSLGYKFKEVAVSKNYPSRTNYSKIRPILDWWSIIRPLVLLRLGIKK
ncbi:MAG: glycosyltransferase family 2 protein [Elusimicrobia bacterium]|nr:glycosyltransferase family 2 protein [Elusimicrobiota bacterium]